MNGAKPSKSALKRESLALQTLGEKLMRLTQSELESMQLDSPLLRAVVDAKSIRSHSALRRQRQLIGKLMRSADAARIESSLDALTRQDRLARSLFHAAEAWRHRICTEGAPALAEFTVFTGRDNARLRDLLQEQETAAHEAAVRAVRRRAFREIHDELMRMKEHPHYPDSDTES